MGRRYRRRAQLADVHGGPITDERLNEAKRSATVGKCWSLAVRLRSKGDHRQEEQAGGGTGLFDEFDGREIRRRGQEGVLDGLLDRERRGRTAAALPRKRSRKETPSSPMRWTSAWVPIRMRSPSSADRIRDSRSSGCSPCRRGRLATRPSRAKDETIARPASPAPEVSSRTFASPAVEVQQGTDQLARRGPRFGVLAAFERRGQGLDAGDPQFESAAIRHDHPPIPGSSWAPNAGE